MIASILFFQFSKFPNTILYPESLVTTPSPQVVLGGLRRLSYQVQVMTE